MEAVIVTLIGIMIVLLLLIGYMLYITNVKLEETKAIVTDLNKNITSFHTEDKTLWKEVSTILKRILEMV